MRIHLFGAIALLLGLSACSYNNAYRTESTLCSYGSKGDCVSNFQQVTNQGSEKEYHLGFIEYDDQGQIRSPERKNILLNHYRTLAGQNDIILLTYVHGWHHSAEPGDSDIRHFRTLLEKVSAAESSGCKPPECHARTVLGIYIGWRGDSIDLDYLNTITFWDRKNTAHEVGRQGVTGVLLELEELRNISNIIHADKPETTSRFVVIGHSFGGALVYSSLHKVLADRFIGSRIDKNYQGEAGGFADLVLLMNPAFEALRFSPLFNLSQEGCRSYQPQQLPKLAILTSKADYATGIAFPLGRAFSTFFESHRTMTRHYCSKPTPEGKVEVEISQGSADRQAVGHFEPYQTHELTAKPKDKAGKTFDLLGAYRNWSASDDSLPEPFTSVTLTSKQRTTARNPYMNIAVDKSLIKDHNDIWGEEIKKFISELIQMSATPKAVYDKMLKQKQ